MSDKKNEYIMYGTYLPEVIFGSLGTLAITNYSIVFKTDKIIITPYDKVTNSPINNKSFTINRNEIKKISITNGNYGFFKIIIHGYQEDLFGFQISKNIREEQKNILYFINEHYIVENLDLIIEKKEMSKTTAIIVAIILLILMIIGCVGAIYSYGIFGIIFTIIVIISMIKWFKDIKKNKER